MFKPFQIIILTIVAAVILFTIIPTPLSARTQVDSYNYRAPMNYTFFNQCTNENVQLSGWLHGTEQTITLADGSRHVIIRSNYQGISGYGLTSGESYHSVGTGGYILFNDPDITRVTTGIYNEHLVTPGSGNNYTVHGLTRYTWNAAGELVVSIEIRNIDCR